jgi:hypothetical protein
MIIRIIIPDYCYTFCCARPNAAHRTAYLSGNGEPIDPIIFIFVVIYAKLWLKDI